MNDIVAPVSLKAGRPQRKTSTVCTANLNEASAAVSLAYLAHSRCNISYYIKSSIHTVPKPWSGFFLFYHDLKIITMHSLNISR